MNKKNKIILGTVQFGLNYGINNVESKPTKNKVYKMLDFATEHGIEILDTADAYGNASEIIGKYNAVYPERFLINTKFQAKGLQLSKQLEASFAKLQTNHVNTYFYHSFFDFVNYPAIQEELKILKMDGKINKVGISVYDNEEFKIAIDSDIIDTIQFPFNLLDNYYQRGELMTFAKERGKELQVRSVFLQGLFFKTLDSIPPKLTPLKPYLQLIHDLSNKYQFSIEQLALMYAIQQPAIDYIIIGVDNLEQLKQNMYICNQNFSDEIFEKINQIKVHETNLLYPKNW